MDDLVEIPDVLVQLKGEGNTDLSDCRLRLILNPDDSVAGRPERGALNAS